MIALHKRRAEEVKSEEEEEEEEDGDTSTSWGTSCQQLNGQH